MTQVNHISNNPLIWWGARSRMGPFWYTVNVREELITFGGFANLQPENLTYVNPLLGAKWKMRRLGDKPNYRKHIWAISESHSLKRSRWIKEIFTSSCHMEVKTVLRLMAILPLKEKRLPKYWKFTWTMESSTYITKRRESQLEEMDGVAESMDDPCCAQEPFLHELRNSH